MPVKGAKTSLKILVANAQLSVTRALATSWSLNLEAPQNMGVFVFKFWGLRGLCFQDTLSY